MGTSAKGTQGPGSLCIWAAGAKDPGLVGHCPGQGKVGGLTISLQLPRWGGGGGADAWVLGQAVQSLCHALSCAGAAA